MVLKNNMGNRVSQAKQGMETDLSIRADPCMDYLYIYRDCLSMVLADIHILGQMDVATPAIRHWHLYTGW